MSKIKRYNRRSWAVDIPMLVHSRARRRLRQKVHGPRWPHWECLHRHLQASQGQQINDDERYFTRSWPSRAVRASTTVSTTKASSKRSTRCDRYATFWLLERSRARTRPAVNARHEGQHRRRETEFVDEMEDGGFTIVLPDKVGTRKFVSDGGATTVRIASVKKADRLQRRLLDKEEADEAVVSAKKKRQRKELYKNDFYKFQMKVVKKDALVELRKGFELDKIKLVNRKWRKVKE